MKKYVAIVLSLLAAFSLCACDYSFDSETAAPIPKCDITVSFSSDKLEMSSDDGFCYYEQSLTTASVHSDKDDRAAKKMNDELNTLYSSLRSEAKHTSKLAADQTGDELTNLKYICDASATRCDAKVLSLVFDVQCDNGGIHDEYTRYSRSFDSDSGKALSLDDLSSDTEKLKTFLTNYVLGLAAGNEYIQDGQSVFFEDYEDVITGIIEDGSNWFFSDKGIVIYANPYDIAQSELGVIEFTVPYITLQDFADNEWMPVELEGENGIVLAEDGTKFDRDSLRIIDTVTVDEEGQSVILSAEETVYNVKLIYSDFEASTHLLWIRNYLSTGEAVELLSYIPDVMPNIMVEYTLADGTVVTRGVFQSGEDGSIMLVEPDIA